LRSALQARQAQHVRRRDQHSTTASSVASSAKASAEAAGKRDAPAALQERWQAGQERCNRDKHSRWAAAAAAAVEQLSSHGRHGDKRGDRQDKRGVRRGKRGDQRGQQDTHGDRVTRAAASEA
jgi:hypothetical protein